MSRMKGMPSQVVGAFRAGRIRRIARLRKHLCDDALERAVVVDHQKPADRLAVLELLPQARGRGRIERTRGHRAGKRNRKRGGSRQQI